MGQPSLHCNIIKCSSVSTNQMAKHFLAVETQVEDIGIKEMLQNYTMKNSMKFSLKEKTECLGN